MTNNKQVMPRSDTFLNQRVYICLAWIAAWYIIANLIDTSITSSQLVLIAKISIIAGSFYLAYLLGLKTKDKIGLVSIMIILGTLLSYFLIIPFMTYVNFVLYFL